MRGYFIVLVCMLALTPLFSMTYFVSQDGSADFTTIQVAVDASVSSDYIIVNPGRYVEQVNTNG
jgi:pectin methylesterase-like acyl-CoA thioesterase